MEPSTEPPTELSEKKRGKQQATGVPPRDEAANRLRNLKREEVDSCLDEEEDVTKRIDDLLGDDESPWEKEESEGSEEEEEEEETEEGAAAIVEELRRNSKRVRTERERWAEARKAKEETERLNERSMAMAAAQKRKIEKSLLPLCDQHWINASNYGLVKEFGRRFCVLFNVRRFVFFLRKRTHKVETRGEGANWCLKELRVRTAELQRDDDPIDCAGELRLGREHEKLVKDRKLEKANEVAEFTIPAVTGRGSVRLCTQVCNWCGIGQGYNIQNIPEIYRAGCCDIDKVDANVVKELRLHHGGADAVRRLADRLGSEDTRGAFCNRVSCCERECLLKAKIISSRTQTTFEKTDPSKRRSNNKCGNVRHDSAKVFEETIVIIRLLVEADLDAAGVKFGRPEDIEFLQKYTDEENKIGHNYENLDLFDIDKRIPDHTLKMVDVLLNDVAQWTYWLESHERRYISSAVVAMENAEEFGLSVESKQKYLDMFADIPYYFLTRVVRKHILNLNYPRDLKEKLKVRKLDGSLKDIQSWLARCVSLNKNKYPSPYDCMIVDQIYNNWVTNSRPRENGLPVHWALEGNERAFRLLGRGWHKEKREGQKVDVEHCAARTFASVMAPRLAAEIQKQHFDKRPPLETHVMRSTGTSRNGIFSALSASGGSKIPRYLKHEIVFYLTQDLEGTRRPGKEFTVWHTEAIKKNTSDHHRSFAPSSVTLFENQNVEAFQRIKNAGICMNLDIREDDSTFCHVDLTHLCLEYKTVPCSVRKKLKLEDGSDAKDEDGKQLYETVPGTRSGWAIRDIGVKRMVAGKAESARFRAAQRVDSGLSGHKLGDPRRLSVRDAIASDRGVVRIGETLGIGMRRPAAGATDVLGEEERARLEATSCRLVTQPLTRICTWVRNITDISRPSMPIRGLQTTTSSHDPLLVAMGALPEGWNVREKGRWPFTAEALVEAGRVADLENAKRIVDVDLALRFLNRLALKWTAKSSATTLDWDELRLHSTVLLTELERSDADRNMVVRALLSDLLDLESRNARRAALQARGTNGTYRFNPINDLRSVASAAKLRVRNHRSGIQGAMFSREVALTRATTDVTNRPPPKQPKGSGDEHDRNYPSFMAARRAGLAASMDFEQYTTMDINRTYAMNTMKWNEQKIEFLKSAMNPQSPFHCVLCFPTANAGYDDTGSLVGIDATALEHPDFREKLVHWQSEGKGCKIPGQPNGYDHACLDFDAFLKARRKDEYLRERPRNEAEGRKFFLEGKRDAEPEFSKTDMQAMDAHEATQAAAALLLDPPTTPAARKEVLERFFNKSTPEEEEKKLKDETEDEVAKRLKMRNFEAWSKLVDPMYKKLQREMDVAFSWRSLAGTQTQRSLRAGMPGSSSDAVDLESAPQIEGELVDVKIEDDPDPEPEPEPEPVQVDAVVVTQPQENEDEDIDDAMWADDEPSDNDEDAMED